MIRRVWNATDRLTRALFVAESLLLVVLALLLAGCPGQDAWTIARKTVTPIDKAALLAHQTWEKVQKDGDDRITATGIAQNKAPAAIRAELAAWRAKGDKAQAALRALFDGLHSAKLAIDAGEAGAKGAIPLGQVLTGLAHLVRGVLAILAEYTDVNIPPEFKAFVDQITPGGA